VKSHRKILK